MSRIFFAVGVSSEVSAALGRLQTEVERIMPPGCLRFTAPGQAHVTLRFLGERSPAEQAAAIRAGNAAARVLHPFDLAFVGLGVFPDERLAHTLWVGAGQGASELSRLAGLLASRLAEEGFAAEERPFVPHLTLARLLRRAPSRSISALLNHAVAFPAATQVETFDLLESQPTPGGVRYVPLATFRLETACTPSR